MTNVSLMKVKRIAGYSPWSILQYFWPALSKIGLENQFLVYLRVAVLHRFYCNFIINLHCVNANSVDPDQLTSSEASWFGSTLISKEGFNLGKKVYV